MNKHWQQLGGITVIVVLYKEKELYAFVDTLDFPLVASHHWYAHKNRNCFYAVTTVREGKKRKWVGMSQMILKCAPLIAEHEDHNGLNNCRSNLRIATIGQNNANARKLKSRASKYKGVARDKRRKRWTACISLGHYLNETDAAKAYDAAAKKIHGKFANLNFKED